MPGLSLWNSMSRKEKDEDEDLISQFLERHEAQIGAIINAFAKNIEEGGKQRQRNLIVVMGFMIALVLIVSVLAYLHVLTGESVTFLIGSIIGYSFAFLKGYLAPGAVS
jgi:sorbitol-specific phosphotransferase system component IIBC